MAVKEVNQVLDDLGMGRYQWTQLVCVSVIYLLDGAEVLVASSILDSLEVQWDLEPWMKGAFVSMIFIGVFIGNSLGGLLADWVGRRPVVLYSAVGVVIFGMGSSQANHPWTLLILRFCFGLLYGLGAGAGITLVVESVPSEWRSNIVNITQLFFVFGEMFAAALLVIFMPNLGAQLGNSWRWVTALAVSPGLLAAPFMFAIMQETPHFLVVQGREEDAMAALRQIASINNTPDVVADMTSLRMPQNPQAATGSSEAAPASSTWDRLVGIFGSEYRSITLGGGWILFVSNWNFFGLLYALPIVFGHMGVPVSAAFQVLVASTFDLPGIVVVWLLVRSKEIGHRDALAGLAILAAVAFIAMTTLDLGDAAVAVSLPSAYLAKYAVLAFFNLGYIYLAEVFPTAIRGTAFGLCLAMGRLGGIIAPSYFEATTTTTKHWAFFVTCSVTFLIAVFVIRYALIYEKKDQALEGFVMQKNTGELPVDTQAQEPAAPPATAELLDGAKAS